MQKYMSNFTHMKLFEWEKEIALNIITMPCKIYHKIAFLIKSNYINNLKILLTNLNCPTISDQPTPEVL